MSTRATIALILLLGSGTASAQESAILGTGGAGIINKGYLRLGTNVFFEMEGTTADGFEMTFRHDMTLDGNYIWPATIGSAGQQLQTDATPGATQLSWASAASTRDTKILAGLLAPQEALASILATPIHRFRYKAGMGTQDATTEYAGILAEEAPWAMHFNGTVLNPVNTAGYAFSAIQALQAEIDTLKAQLAERTRRTWRTLWLVARKE